MAGERTELYLKGQEYLGNGKYKEAIAAFNAALEVPAVGLEPGDRMVLYYLSVTYSWDNNFDLSIGALQRALTCPVTRWVGMEKDPDDAMIFRAMGDLYQDNGQTEEAEEYYKKADQFDEKMRQEEREKIKERLTNAGEIVKQGIAKIEEAHAKMLSAGGSQEKRSQEERLYREAEALYLEGFDLFRTVLKIPGVVQVIGSEEQMRMGFYLAQTYFALGSYHEAHQLIRKLRTSNSNVSSRMMTSHYPAVTATVAQWETFFRDLEFLRQGKFKKIGKWKVGHPFYELRVLAEKNVHALMEGRVGEVRLGDPFYPQALLVDMYTKTEQKIKDLLAAGQKAFSEEHLEGEEGAIALYQNAMKVANHFLFQGFKTLPPVHVLGSQAVQRVGDLLNEAEAALFSIHILLPHIKSTVKVISYEAVQELRQVLDCNRVTRKKKPEGWEKSVFYQKALAFVMSAPAQAQEPSHWFPSSQRGASEGTYVGAPTVSAPPGGTPTEQKREPLPPVTIDLELLKEAEKLQRSARISRALVSLGTLIYAASWGYVGMLVGALALGLTPPMLFVAMPVGIVAGAIFFGILKKGADTHYSTVAKNTLYLGSWAGVGLMIGVLALGVNPFSLMALAALAVGIGAGMLLYYTVFQPLYRWRVGERSKEAAGEKRAEILPDGETHVPERGVDRTLVTESKRGEVQAPRVSGAGMSAPAENQDKRPPSPGSGSSGS